MIGMKDNERHVVREMKGYEATTELKHVLDSWKISMKENEASKR